MSTLNQDHKIPASQANMFVRDQTEDVQIKTNPLSSPSALGASQSHQVFLKDLGNGTSLGF